MIRPLFWICAVVIALASLNALAADLFLPNGNRAQGETRGDQLFLITPTGQVLAPDGQYRMADGRAITVRGGRILLGMAITNMPRAIGPKPDDPLAARPIQPITPPQPAAMPQPITPIGIPGQPPLPPRAAIGNIASSGLPPLQPLQVRVPPQQQGPVGGLPPLRPVQTQLATSPQGNGGSQPTVFAMPAVASPSAALHAKISADPATLLAAARAQNKRLKAMVEDLKSRIANRKDGRQLFCSDYDVSSNKQGGQRSCFPFACNLDTGACLTSANGSDQCSIGEYWDGGTGCIAPTPSSSSN